MTKEVKSQFQKLTEKKKTDIYHLTIITIQEQNFTAHQRATHAT